MHANSYRVATGAFGILVEACPSAARERQRPRQTDRQKDWRSADAYGTMRKITIPINR